jgi:hypothetical protein
MFSVYKKDFMNDYFSAMSYVFCCQTQFFSATYTWLDITPISALAKKLVEGTKSRGINDAYKINVLIDDKGTYNCFHVMLTFDRQDMQLFVQNIKK